MLFGVLNILPLILIEMEIMPNHVHMLIEVDPKFGIYKVIKNLKGGSPLSEIKEYIKNQKTSQRS